MLTTALRFEGLSRFKGNLSTSLHLNVSILIVIILKTKYIIFEPRTDGIRYYEDIKYTNVIGSSIFPYTPPTTFLEYPYSYNHQRFF